MVYHANQYSSDNNIAVQYISIEVYGADSYAVVQHISSDVYGADSHCVFATFQF